MASVWRCRWDGRPLAVKELMTEVVPQPTILVTDCPIFSGPIKSDRLNTAVGIDLGSLDRSLAVSREVRLPRASVVVTTVARHLIRISKSGEKVESIVVYGSEQDPAAHPDIRTITENLRELRNKWFSKAKLSLVTDCGLLTPEMPRLLNFYDRVYARFEYGTAKSYAAATGHKPADYSTACGMLTGLSNLIIVTRVPRGEVDASSETEVKAWIKKVGELKPREVWIQTVEAKGKKTKAPAKTRLTEIAAEVTEKTGIAAHIVTGEQIYTRPTA
jgi:hypothetical protein